MQPIPKCFLLPLREEIFPSHSLGFIRNLYPDLQNVRILLCYFLPALPPIYDERSGTPDLERQRQQALKLRLQRSRQALQSLKSFLIEQGFSEDSIEEHTTDRTLSIARQTCMIADIKKVDAVIMERQMSSNLEAFLKGDLTPALLNHCLVSPIWFIDGNANASRIAIFLDRNEAVLRTVDHCAFMLQETGAQVTLLRLNPSLREPWTSPAAGWREGLDSLLEGETLEEEVGLFSRALEILREHAIEDRRIALVMLPRKGQASRQLLAYCEDNDIGIVALGHSNPSGLFSFLRRPLIMEILNGMKNMALWAIQ